MKVVQGERNKKRRLVRDGSIVINDVSTHKS